MSTDILSAIVEIWPENPTRRMVAERLGITHGQANYLMRVCVKRGLVERQTVRNTPGPKPRTMIDERSQAIIAMWPTNKSQVEIAASLGISVRVTRKRIRKLIEAGIIVRRVRVGRTKALNPPKSYITNAQIVRAARFPKAAKQPLDRRPEPSDGHHWDVTGRTRTCLCCGARQFQSTRMGSLTRPGVAAWLPVIGVCDAERVAA